MNPFEVTLFEMLPEMPEPLALTVLACLVLLTIAHPIYRIRTVLTKGFALHHEISVILEMIKSGKSYTDILTFMRNHQRGSKDPIVAAIQLMIYHAMVGLDGFVEAMDQYRELAEEQSSWYTRNRMLPSTIVFLTLMTLGSMACTSLTYSDMTWGLMWISSGYWAIIAAARQFTSFFGGVVTREKFWSIFSALLQRLNAEGGHKVKTNTTLRRSTSYGGQARA